MWGGPVPDPVQALAKMLAALSDDEGRIAIPGVREQVRPLGRAEEDELRKIPFNEKEFREQSGMIPTLKLLREGPNPVAQLWRFPSLTVTAIQASSRKQAGNIINDAAWAKVTVRLVPDMDPELVARQLEDFLLSKAPWGVDVKFSAERGSPAWSTEPR
jgi:acetylornithine deacetylase/succinyl-diaminopimelate desuccinylase-like protein